MTTKTQTNREAWLSHAIKALTPIFEEKGYTVPDCYPSCGFASSGIRSGHIGQCWSRKSCSSGINQIFICPTLEDPVAVLDTLVHEMVHAVDNCEHGHGKEFKKIATTIGLVGPMRSASAGPELRLRLKDLADRLGPYPHSAIQKPRKRVRLYERPKAVCSECGFTVPMLKAFLHIGPPICPRDKIEMEPEGNWDVL